MTQYVNFYSSEFHKPKVSFSFVQNVRVLIAFFVCLVLYAGWYQMQINEVQGYTEELQKGLKVDGQQSSSQSLIEKLVERKTVINRQIQLLQEDIAKKKVIAYVYKDKSGQELSSFYSIFSEVAKSSDANLALTNIEIYNGGGEILVSGLARYKSEIPEFIARMRTSNVLATAQFGLLTVERIPENNLYRFTMERNP